MDSAEQRSHHKLPAATAACIAAVLPRPQVSLACCHNPLQLPQNVAALFGGAVLGQYAMFNATGTSVSGNRAIYGGWDVVHAGFQRLGMCLASIGSPHAVASACQLPTWLTTRRFCVGTSAHTLRGPPLPAGGGGGVKMMSGVCLLKDCTLRGNKATYGGALEVGRGWHNLRCMPSLTTRRRTTPHPPCLLPHRSSSFRKKATE